MIALEHLGDGSVSDRNFRTLRALTLDTGGVTAGIRWGVATVTFSAATSSAALTVSHGLGRAPVNVQLTCESTSDFRATYSAVDSDSFDVKAHASSNQTGNVNVSWVAVG